MMQIAIKIKGSVPDDDLILASAFLSAYHQYFIGGKIYAAYPEAQIASDMAGIPSNRYYKAIGVLKSGCTFLEGGQSQARMAFGIRLSSPPTEESSQPKSESKSDQKFAKGENLDICGEKIRVIEFLAEGAFTSVYKFVFFRDFSFFRL
jgi:hypothetical protein